MATVWQVTPLTAGGRLLWWAVTPSSHCSTCPARHPITPCTMPRETTQTTVWQVTPLTAGGRLLWWAVTPSSHCSTCPARHHNTLHYATGDNPDVFVAMAAKLLHCQEVGSSANQLLDMVSRLTNTSTVSELSSPCPPPASTALANLEVWDCTSHMVHVHSLLQLVNLVTLLTHYQIGEFLSHTAGAAWHSGRHCQRSLPGGEEALRCHSGLVRL